jgi:hypothetical protein
MLVDAQEALLGFYESSSSTSSLSTYATNTGKRLITATPMPSSALGRSGYYVHAYAQAGRYLATVWYSMKAKRTLDRREFWSYFAEDRLRQLHVALDVQDFLRYSMDYSYSYAHHWKPNPMRN